MGDESLDDIVKKNVLSLNEMLDLEDRTTLDLMGPIGPGMTAILGHKGIRYAYYLEYYPPKHYYFRKLYEVIE